MLIIKYRVTKLGIVHISNNLKHSASYNLHKHHYNMESNPQKTFVFRIKKASVPNANGRVAWSRNHDDKLKVLVEKHNGKKWKKIADEMQKHFNNNELTAKKCREHWYNFTDPNLNKTSLTEAEELFILVYHHKYKNKWAVISQYLPSRNNNKIKNNFSSLIKRVCRKIALNIVEEISTMLEYVKFLLLEMSEGQEDITAVTSVYLYEHVMERRLSVSQCAHYAACITKGYLHGHSERTKLQKLASFAQVQQMENFLIRFFSLVKASFGPSSELADSALIELAESVLVENSPQTEANALPMLSAAATAPCGHAAYKQMANRSFEFGQMLESSPLQTPLEHRSDLHLPVPTFASPAFQAALQLLTPGFSPSPQFRSYSPRVSFGGFSPLPGSVAGSLLGRPFVVPAFTQVSAKESDTRLRYTEFSMFSDTFLQQ
eukprot:TRINITY_DN7388_c0_g1_i2.p1 TRINITY_DN7388_c0_g1~~TRINITY_DN7388_c0_g1_i2.p1  ORF type:complete len:433 (-),score=65.17 TRINITY_DN7388_c0_g1_i2:1567-2865(-)